MVVLRALEHNVVDSTPVLWRVIEESQIDVIGNIVKRMLFVFKECNTQICFLLNSEVHN